MAEYDDKQISEFNEAKFQIIRLNYMWNNIRLLREHGKLIAVRWKLDSVAAELWIDAERIDQTEKDDSGDSIVTENGYIHKINQIDDFISKCVKEKNHEELYKRLMEKEKLLRKIQDKAGKGGRYTQAEDDF